MTIHQGNRVCKTGKGNQSSKVLDAPCRPWEFLSPARGTRPRDVPRMAGHPWGAAPRSVPRVRAWLGGQRALTVLLEMPFLVLQTPIHRPNHGLFLTLVCVFQKQIF